MRGCNPLCLSFPDSFYFLFQLNAVTIQGSSLDGATRACALFQSDSALIDQKQSLIH